MGKIVTTYLIDGDPKGKQYVFISNEICQILGDSVLKAIGIEIYE